MRRRDFLKKRHKPPRNPASSVLSVLLVAACIGWAHGVNVADRPSVEIVPDADAQRVDVLVDGELFTSYVYSDTLAVLKKPVLYPIRAADGVEITRGYPISPRAGDRVDHPHQIGLWLNYGDVNGLDFWGNSDAVPDERRNAMGTIRNRSIERTSGGEGIGTLVVAADWLKPDGDVILEERTRFIFRADAGLRTIDRITTLTGLDEHVAFGDTKEGMMGLRVTRALEMPMDQAVNLVGREGDVVESSNNQGVNGHYRNSEGISGYPNVWGERARWMMLTGRVEGEIVTVAILDHPENVGHPTYWHARDYGLFAANPLGQAAFSDGKERLAFSLEPGDAVTFRYRIVVLSGDAAASDVEALYRDFAAANLEAPTRNDR